MNWQPIETCPNKDLEKVVLWTGKNLVVGYWYRENCEYHDVYAGNILPEPTHWMPLPAPPPDPVKEKKPFLSYMYQGLPTLNMIENILGRLGFGISDYGTNPDGSKYLWIDKREK